MTGNPYWNPCPICNCDAERVEMVRELRTALGMFAGAMPITPKEAWDEAIARATHMTMAVSDGE